MKKNHSRILAVLLALVMVLGLLAGCGGSNSQPPSSNDNQPPSTSDNQPPSTDDNQAPATDDTQEPDINETGVLKLQWAAQMGTDTQFEDFWFDQQCLYNQFMFEGLIGYDDNPGNIIPKLATEWTVNDDYTVYTFTLREGVTWSDGEPLTMEDVLFTYNAQAANPNSTRGPKLANIVGYDEVVNGEADTMSGFTAEGNVLTVTLKAPTPTFIYSMSHEILPKHLFEGVEPADMSYADFWKHPIGCGPYVIDTISYPDYFTLVRNDSYWGEPAGIKNVQFVSYASGGNDSVVAAAINGDLDYIYGNAVNDISIANNINSQNGDMSIVDIAGSYTRFFAFNLDQRADGNNKADLLKPEVRQAFDLIIDQPTIASFYAGQATALSTFCNPNDTENYNSDVPMAGKDIETAKQMLQDAGFDFSQTIDIAYYYSDTTTIDIMSLLEQDFTAAGVNVNIQLLSGDLATLIYTDANYDLIYLASGQSLPCDLYNKCSTARSSYTFIGDVDTRAAIWDDLYESYVSTGDVQEQREIGYQLQALDYQNRYTIPAYALNTIVMYNKAHVSIPDICFEGTSVGELYLSQWSLVG